MQLGLMLQHAAGIEKNRREPVLFFVPTYTMCVETLLYIGELLFYNYNCKDYEFAVLPLPQLAYYLDF